jgi:hydroxyacylglutathione hydrolase
MFIQQLYTNCLAEAAYYIESNGKAAIIDPMRDTQSYIGLAESRNAEIKYIFETHFHADFVSGHLDLAQKTGAQIVYGPTAEANFEILVAEDNQVFELGNIHLKVLHTPGHTMESSCFLLIDQEGKEHAVFTGDTLFIGDVGRPDLAVKSDLSREDLARFLYRSINEKLLTLNDETIVYPGHGAGSQCGKNLSAEKSCTIGTQKKTNYALLEDSEEGFVKSVTEGLTLPPPYFHKNAVLNKQGYKSLDDILERGNKSIRTDLFSQAIQHKKSVVVDTRNKATFTNGYVPDSIYLGLQGSYATWAGTLIKDLSAPIILITDHGKEEESITRLARVGFDNIIGYLEGGFNEWKDRKYDVGKIKNQCPVDFAKNTSNKNILDVRTEAEFAAGHVENAINMPLASLLENIAKLNRKKEYHIYCKSGYRSVIAASILRKIGFEKLVNIKKGYQGITSPQLTCCCTKTMLKESTK